MGHEHGKHKADLTTILGAIGELVEGLISDSYWIGSIIDLALQLLQMEAEETAIGLSWKGIWGGLGVAVLTAVGSAYSHLVLNSHYQEPPKTAAGPQATEEGADITLQLSSDVTRFLPQIPPISSSLSWAQRAALVGNFISHTGGIAGGLEFAGDKILDYVGAPRYAKPLSRCAFTLFGASASIADSRACLNAMRKANKYWAQKQAESGEEPPQRCCPK